MNEIEIDKKEILLVFFVALAYFVFGKLSFIFALQNAIVTIAIFAAEGIALAAALLFGRKVLVGIFIGQLALALSEELGVFVAGGIAFVNALEALMAIKIQERMKLDLSFASMTSVLSVFTLIAFILQPFSSVFGNLFLYLGGIVTFEELPSSLFSWWFGNVMGQILITPALILLYHEYKKRALEIDKLVMTLLFFFFVIVLFTSYLPIENMALLIGITLPLILVTGFRIGEAYGAAAMILIAYTLLYCTHVGIGPFTKQAPVDNIININFYILVHVLVYYITLGLYREKESALSKLHACNVDLEQTARERLEEIAKEERKVLPSLLLVHTQEITDDFSTQCRHNLLELKAHLLSIDEKIKEDQNAMIEFEEVIEKIDSDLKKIAAFEKLFEKNKPTRIFSLGEIVKDALNIVQPSLKEAHIRLLIEIDQNYIVKGYPDELTQILFFIFRYIKEAYHRLGTSKRRFVKIKLQGSPSKLIVRFETALKLESPVEDITLLKSMEDTSSLAFYTIRLLVRHYLQGDLQIDNHTQNSLILTLPKTNGL